MRILICAMAWLLLSGHAAWADHLPPPSGRVILSVDGAVDHLNTPSRVDFDLAMLEALPQHTLETKTPWTEGIHRYEGIQLSELLDHLDARGDTLIATALNDYHATLNARELADYPVLIAIKQDGEYMRVRDKGPLWIVYPLSDYEALNRPNHHAGMVWQLRKLEIR